jgi:hypothetical protein
MDDIDGKTGEELVEDGTSMDILPKAIQPPLRSTWTKSSNQSRQAVVGVSPRADLLRHKI